MTLLKALRVFKEKLFHDIVDREPPAIESEDGTEPGILLADGKVIIERATFTVHCGEQSCTLSGKPWELFLRLAAVPPGRYLSVKVLFDDVWGDANADEKKAVKQAAYVANKQFKGKSIPLTLDGESHYGFYRLIINTIA